MNMDSIKQYLTDKNFDITRYDSLGTQGLPESREEREKWLHENSHQLAKLQELFCADKRFGLLVILQGMDTSGKDGTVRHVFHDANPLGLKVHSFKSPTEEELSHDYLWRIHQAVPRRGEIAIFNRSHYEDVLITHVRGWIDDKELQLRLRQINDFERMLTENNILIIKMFLHISKDEQRYRLQKRLDNTHKHWKFNLSDLTDRKLWDKFQEQYQTVIRATAQTNAPWYIVPADSKSSRNIIVMKILTAHLQQLNLQYPRVDDSNWPKTVD